MKIDVRRFGRWVPLLPAALLLQGCVSKAYVPAQQVDGAFTRHDARFNVKAEGQQSIFTLLEGEMALSRPSYVRLKPGQQITIAAGGVEEVRSLSAKEVEEVTRWRDRFPPPCASGGGECAPPGGPSTWGQCTD